MDFLSEWRIPMIIVLQIVLFLWLHHEAQRRNLFLLQQYIATRYGGQKKKDEGLWTKGYYSAVLSPDPRW